MHIQSIVLKSLLTAALVGAIPVKRDAQIPSTFPTFGFPSSVTLPTVLIPTPTWTPLNTAPTLPTISPSNPLKSFTLPKPTFTSKFPSQSSILSSLSFDVYIAYSLKAGTELSIPTLPTGTGFSIPELPTGTDFSIPRFTPFGTGNLPPFPVGTGKISFPPFPILKPIETRKLPPRPTGTRQFTSPRIPPGTGRLTIPTASTGK
ncbi:hypothetical protein IFR04_008361 [Cadophora malorum]|uniref:Uncharacterized protein n=1 Tax=Cadophora malorum TaxID=108018 RepID=A0A8H7W7S0_9HELO|nr:hypothetical protein IFR04_008361 [Cadophora malorum]